MSSLKTYLSPDELESLGLHEIIYVRKSPLNNERYAVHAADGTVLAILEDEESAYAAALANDLKLMSVH